jgi:hypothetical protein
MTRDVIYNLLRNQANMIIIMFIIAIGHSATVLNYVATSVICNHNVFTEHTGLFNLYLRSFEAKELLLKENT